MTHLSDKTKLKFTLNNIQEFDFDPPIIETNVTMQRYFIYLFNRLSVFNLKIMTLFLFFLFKLLSVCNLKIMTLF